MGCIGLSYDDFCRLRPSEFNDVCKAYVDNRTSVYQDGWERMRMLACITVQPHVKRKLTPKKLIPLPWDNKRKGSAKPVKGDKARMAEMFAKYGDKYNTDGKQEHN